MAHRRECVFFGKVHTFDCSEAVVDDRRQRVRNGHGRRYPVCQCTDLSLILGTILVIAGLLLRPWTMLIVSAILSLIFWLMRR